MNPKPKEVFMNAKEKRIDELQRAQPRSCERAFKARPPKQPQLKKCRNKKLPTTKQNLIVNQPSPFPPPQRMFTKSLCIFFFSVGCQAKEKKKKAF